jgi:6-phosphogluconolactonase
MRAVLVLALVVLCGLRANAAVEPFYLGTMTGKSGSQGIYSSALDSDTGKLGPVTLAAKAKDPGFLALTPDGKFILAALDSAVGSFQIEPGGKLTALNQEPSGGDGTCHVSIDPSGRAVFVANYGGGNIAAFQLAANGVIAKRFALIPFTGSGPDPERQKKPFAHSIYADAQDKFVYACDLGSDSIWIFKFDPLRSTLTPANSPAAKVPPGSGPRHLAFSPDGRLVYVINEMGASVSIFARDLATGALTLRDTVPALMPGIGTGRNTAAEIALHPSGHFLYASVRGWDVISVFAVAADGSLKLIQNTPSIAKFPRSFAIDPSGHWMIVAGQNDSRIAVLAIDPVTGLLTATDQVAAVGSPICVLFAK